MKPDDERIRNHIRFRKINNADPKIENKLVNSTNSSLDRVQAFTNEEQVGKIGKNIKQL